MTSPDSWHLRDFHQLVEDVYAVETNPRLYAELMRDLTNHPCGSGCKIVACEDGECCLDD